MFKKILFSFIVTLFLFACNNQDNAKTGQAADSIRIENAYIRTMPPGQKVTAMFVELHNDSAQSHKLVAATSDASEHVELHEHIKVDGMMRMQQVESIAIPAKTMTALKPGGYHIMLINLKQNLTIGQKVPVTLRFEDDSSVPLQVEVKAITMNK